MRVELKPIQSGGMCHVWQRPDRTFRHVLVKLNLACEGDPYPGILIVADGRNSNARAVEIRNLRKELPDILNSANPGAMMYWRIHRDDMERRAILKGLTDSPTFFG